MDVINWLNVNDGAVMGIATVVLVVITGYYAYLTRKQLKASDTPEIAISLRPHEVHVNLVMLCIENIGSGAARNLQFVPNPSSIPNLDMPFEKISFLKNGIAYFEPGRKIEQFLVNVISKFDQLKQTPFEITVKFQDTVDQLHERTFYLDFTENEGFAQIDRPPLYEIAKATKEIQKDLHHITTGFRKPIILTESLSEHRLGQSVDSLESRIEQLPEDVQREILQEIDICVSKREQQVQEKDEDGTMKADTNTS